MFNPAKDVMNKIINSHSNREIYKIPNYYMTDYISHTFEKENLQNIITIDIRNATYHKMCPSYLEFEFDTKYYSNFTEDELNHLFEEICENMSFDVTVSSGSIVNIPLHFINHLKPYEKCDNKYYLALHFEMFCDSLNFGQMQYTYLKFYLHKLYEKNICFENGFVSCKLISQIYWYNDDDRKKLMMVSSESVNQILSSTTIFTNKIKSFFYTIPFNHLHKGIFIEVDNIDDISQFEMIANDYHTFGYNKFMLKQLCTKINERLLYIPFNKEKHYANRKHEDMQGAIDLYYIRTHIRIGFSKEQSKIRIYGLGLTWQIYASGYTGLSFCAGECLFTGKHIIAKFKKNGLYNKCFNGSICKLITDENEMLCGITFDELVRDCEYMSCSKCKSNFFEESLKKWLSKTKTCPNCRDDWKDNAVYVNCKSEYHYGDDEEEKEEA